MSNSVPLRAKFSPEITVNAFLDYIRTMAKTTYQNQVPLHHLAQVKTNNVMFVLNKQKLTLDIPGITASAPIELNLNVAKFENFAVSLDEGDGLQGVLEINNIFKPEEFKNFNEHMINVLEDMVAHPNKKLSDLQMLTNDDLRVIELSQTTAMEIDDDSPPPDKFDGLPLDLLMRCAANFPSKKAAFFHYPLGDTESIVFKRLHEHCITLAGFLQNLNCGPGRPPIGICLERTQDLLIAYFATMYTGAVIVPLETDKDAEALRLHKISGLKLILVDHKTKNYFANVKGIHTIDLSDKTTITDISKKLGTSYRRPKLKKEDLINIRYTSGTTGEPKGVMITQGGVTNLINALMLEKIKGNDKILSIAPITFDAFDFDWELAWSRGAEVHYLVEYSPEDLIRIIREYEITVAVFPADVIKALGDPSQFPSLRYVITMGSALDPETQKKWSEYLHRQNGQFINGYGPTENTTATSLHPYAPNDSANNIGKPFPGVKAYVVNIADNKSLVPPGKPGKLFVAGEQLARGFAGRPDLTASQFPWFFHNKKTQKLELSDEKKSDAERFYDTGDNVLIDPVTADLHYLSRKDSQVKISGARIELSAITHALMKQSNLIKDAAVLVNAQNKENLIAYIVPKNLNQPLTTPMLNKILLETSPLLSVARISQVINLKVLPLNKNGKLDTAKLKQYELPKLAAKKSREPNEIESTLLLIFESILGTNEIDLDDHFFYLGGDSRKSGLLEIAINAEFELVNRFKTSVFGYNNLTISNLAKFLKTQIVAKEAAASNSPVTLFASSPPSASSSSSSALNPLGLNLPAMPSLNLYNSIPFA